MIRIIRAALLTPSRAIVLAIATASIVVAVTVPSGSDAYEHGWRGVISFVGGLCILGMMARWRQFWMGPAVMRTARRQEEKRRA